VKKSEMVEIIQDVLLANDYTTNSMVVAAEVLEIVLEAGMVPPDALLPVPHPAIEGVVIMKEQQQWEPEVETDD
jgi:hypothetical protein